VKRALPLFAMPVFARPLFAMGLFAMPMGSALAESPESPALRGPPPGPPPPYQMRAPLPAGDRLAGGKDGAALFSNRCGACHLAGGMGTNLLTKQRVILGEPPEKALLANRTDLTQDYIKIGGDAANNTYVVVPYYHGAKTEQNAKFVDGYTKFTGRTVVDPWEASTFESVGMIAQAILAANVTGDPEKAAAERKAIQGKLAATRGYPGLIGNIDFDKDRVAEKPAVIIRVQDGRWQAL